MKVYDLKINGLREPMGFLMEHISVSWKVADAKDTRQKWAKVEVAEDQEFKTGFHEFCGEELSSVSTILPLVLKPRCRYFFRVTVVGERGEVGISEVSFFETGKMQENWIGNWIGMEEDDIHPFFFKNFALKGKILKARLYLTGVGLYEAFINGKKAGNEVLAPFFNDYLSAVQYQTLDVTDLLKEENEIGIYLGNGWYKGRLGYGGKKEVFGKDFLMIAELHVFYADGREEIIASDETWNYKGSDIEMSDIYDGETCNRLLWEKQENRVKKAVLKKGLPLTDRYSVPLKVMETLSVKELIVSPKDEVILDFGQNFAGRIRFEAKLPKGCKVVIEAGELLQEGCFYRDNYRSAKACFTYVSNGKKEIVTPIFTYTGMRYVRITGWPGMPDPSIFTGEVIYSALERTGFIHTSEPLVNRLFENCLWGQKSNFVDLPTDCPQRDERLGWTGDAQIFAPTASFNMDTQAFFAKYLRDLRFAQQRANGQIPAYLPVMEQNGGSSIWGDAATFIPMVLYEHYGDKELLREQYPMMRDWVEWIRKEDCRRGEKYKFDFGFHFGDWLALDGVTDHSFKGATEDGFVGTAFYYASVKKVAYAASILGFSDEAVSYSGLANKIREAFLDEYFTPQGRLAMDTQAAYIICLRFQLYHSKEKLIEGLYNRLKKDCYKIKCGFAAAPCMCTVLAENGMTELAYQFLLQEDFPGWLYAVNLGATTIWERWNSVLPDGSINPAGMNSLNHYSYGSVMEFLYREAGGLSPLSPGFQKFLLAPKPCAHFSYFEMRYESASGSIFVKWEILADGNLKIHVEVPFGCTCILRLPHTGNKEMTLVAGSYEYTYMPNKNLLNLYNGDSRLMELKKDEETRALVKELVPQAYGMMMSDDPENLALTVKELKEMFYFGINPQCVSELENALMKLRRKIV